jgi:subtilisin family serine protease
MAIFTALWSTPPASAATASYVVVLKPTSDVAAAVNKAKGVGATVSLTYKNALRGYAANIPTDRVSRIAADPAVAYVAPDKPISWPTDPQVCPDSEVDTCQITPVNIDRIDGDVSSTRSGDGRGAVNTNVAVLDTGSGPHTDLNVVGGTSCVTGSASHADQNGHGTHVAGTVAAVDNGFGLVGVAPAARIWSVKVLGKNGGGTDSRILCGIDWVASTRTDADPNNDIRVANMSLAAKGSDDGACGTLNKDAIHAAICGATAKGVLFVVAAGNSSKDLATQVPAAYDEVLTVTAMNDYDRIPGGLATPADAHPACAGFASSGNYPDDASAPYSNFAVNSADAAHTIAAPGTCVTSLWLNSRYAFTTGTSMASPAVAGVAALCISTGACAGITPAQMIQKLRADAAAFSSATPEYGFTGDLVHPHPDGRIFGPLVRAALY